MLEEIFCEDCEDDISIGEIEYDSNSMALCPNDHQLKCSGCKRPLSQSVIESAICYNCGRDLTDDSDEGSELFPNGRDPDAEDEDGPLG